METQLIPPSLPVGMDSLAPDLLRGAEQIAAFLYGSATEKRKVYHLAETTRLPVFRLGALLCARRSVLLAWIEAQERRGQPDPGAGPRG